MAIERVCETCGRTFFTYPCEIKLGRGRYCSIKCIPTAARFRTHGQSKSRLHAIWCHMKTRCACETSLAYSYYGGRGIKVCTEWVSAYEAFRDWALANGYEKSLELDRKDTNGNYEPSNCRWATRTQQMRNTRKRVNAKTSKYKGVSLHSQNKRWVAQIGILGQTKYIGMFDSEIEAAQAYDARARLVFGEYAMTNF